MLNTTFLRVREEKLPELRAWLGALEGRQEELRTVYAAEGTRSEQFFLVRGEDGPVLVIVTELEDRRRGGETFLRSPMPLALEFKQLIQEASDGPTLYEALYDSDGMARGEASEETPPPSRPQDGWLDGG